MVLLGIETSCDETAAAVLKDGVCLSDLIASQADLHGPHGGVVPELACRRHVEVLGPLVRETLHKADCALGALQAVAVTAGPGLIGALLVGASFAKSLAYALHIPLIPVHHLEGHIASVFIEHDNVAFPAVALVVSGGHTSLYALARRGAYRLMGRSVDDAAGEVLDKGARMLGYGYPGGPILDRLAKAGDPNRIPFPRPRCAAPHDFSFSGLKSALARFLAGPQTATDEDIAAGYQSAVVDCLIEKTESAAIAAGAKSVMLVGGVAANSLLRRRIREMGDRLGLAVQIPSPRYCTDNAAMIATAGMQHYEAGQFAPLDFTPDPNLRLGASEN